MDKPVRLMYQSVSDIFPRNKNKKDIAYLSDVEGPVSSVLEPRISMMMHNK
jgi:hypothetical protein